MHPKMNQLFLLSKIEPTENTAADSSDLQNPCVYSLQNITSNVDRTASRY